MAATAEADRKIEYAAWLCQKCGRPLGLTDGRFLYFGGISIGQGCSVGCQCGAVRYFNRANVENQHSPAPH